MGSKHLAGDRLRCDVVLADPGMPCAERVEVTVDPLTVGFRVFDLGQGHFSGPGGFIDACLPVLHEDATLRFAPWRPGAPLRSNRYGIPEPLDANPLRARQLDLRWTPAA